MVQMPAILYGPYAEVREGCRKALSQFVQEQQPLLAAFEAEGMIDTQEHPGLLVLREPKSYVRPYVHFYCTAPLVVMFESVELAPSGLMMFDEVFTALLEKPWSLLWMLDDNCMGGWLYGEAPLDRYRKYLQAMIQSWDELEAEGARYANGLGVVESLWDFAHPLRRAAARLGVPRHLYLDPARGAMPLPPGGLAALVAQADRSLAGDLVDFAAATAASRLNRVSEAPKARISYGEVAPTANEPVYMSEQMLVAVQAHDIEAVTRLIRAGESPDALTPELDDTVLFWAVYHGYTALVRILLDHGANLEDRWAEGESPLMIAASDGHRDIVELLLQRGADPTYVTDKGWSVVDAAEMSNDQELLDLLQGIYRGVE